MSSAAVRGFMAVQYSCRNWYSLSMKHLTPSLMHRVFSSLMGISAILFTASKKEFHLVDVGTKSFLLLTSSTVSDARVDLLDFVQRAVHFAVLLLYTALLSALEVKYVSTSFVEMRLMVCEAHLWCGGRETAGHHFHPQLRGFLRHLKT